MKQAFDEDGLHTAEPMTLDGSLARRIQEELGQNVYLCYQCVKCTSGCPVAEFLDWQPHQIMRAIQLGQEDIALEAKSPWLCASCQTCATRCPQGLDITAIMEFLTREALQQGITSPVPNVNIFNEAFLREVRIWGRAYELGLMAEMKLRTRDIMSDMDLGLKMVRKRKLAFLPSPTRLPRKVKPVAGAADAVAYYPGCSLHSTAPEFDVSSRAVCEALGLNLIEPRGWLCCGSSAAHRADPELGVRLPLENLALIEQSGFKEVTMPCAACFNRHKTTQHEIRHDDKLKQAMDESTGYTFQDTVHVSTLIEAIHNHIGTEEIANRVRNPLKGLRAVCYYGCLLTRPQKVTEAEHPENPSDMDELMTALGMESLDWSYKTTCCGAAHSLTCPDIVIKLSGEIIIHARESGADVVVVACPMCHSNLDARQFQMMLDEPMPVLYFTQLLALALGLPEEASALDKNLVDPRPLLLNQGILGHAGDD
jgi:heterodisulfide reductase subunit B